MIVHSRSRWILTKRHASKDQCSLRGGTWNRSSGGLAGTWKENPGLVSSAISTHFALFDRYFHSSTGIPTFSEVAPKHTLCFATLPNNARSVQRAMQKTNSNAWPRSTYIGRGYPTWTLYGGSRPDQSPPVSLGPLTRHSTAVACL